MSVKVRKVGNSLTLTIPASAVQELKLYDGQELNVSTSFGTLVYMCPNSSTRHIEWRKYETDDADIRDGLTADEYVRGLRDDDR